MVCALCHGMGWRFTLQCGRQWWPCQPCATTGTRVLHGPGEIRIGREQGKAGRDAGVTEGRAELAGDIRALIGAAAA